MMSSTVASPWLFLLLFCSACVLWLHWWRMQSAVRQALQKERDTVVSQNTTLESKLIQMRRLMRELEQNEEKALIQLRNANTARDAAQEQIQQLRTELGRHQAEHQALRSITELELQDETLLRHKIQALEQTNRHLLQRLARQDAAAHTDLEHRLRQQQAEIDTLRTWKQTPKNVVPCPNKVPRLQQQLGRSLHQQRLAKRHVTDMHGRLAQTKQQITTLETENQRLRRLLQHLLQMQHSSIKHEKNSKQRPIKSQVPI